MRSGEDLSFIIYHLSFSRSELSERIYICGVMLHLVPTPIGNLEDVTLRGLRVLREAGTVLCEDTRRARVLLEHYDIGARVESYHKDNEHSRVAGLVERLKGGEEMALVTDAGTPGVSDPGFLLVRAALEAGVEVECLPGATAVVPALVGSGLPCERWCFEGFLPPKKGRQTRLKELADEERVVVLYESPHRLLRTLGELRAVAGGDRRACVCRELTKVHEEFVRGTLDELVAHFEAVEPRGEIVIVLDRRASCARNSEFRSQNG